MQQLVKDLIADGVRGFFNDRAHGEKPVERRADGLLGPNSVPWRVHGDVTTMMVGGLAALMLQMLHPAVLAGVWDHSNFRLDMHGRLRRTTRFIAVTTYGGKAEAEQAIKRVRAVHARVRGELTDGRPYSANDPALLTYVHVTEAICFLEAWKRYSKPMIAVAQQDRYFAEMSEIARRLGAVDVPQTRSEALAYLDSMRPELEASDRSREVMGLLLNPPLANPAFLPLREMTRQAAIDLLPRWARRMHGLQSSKLTRPLVRGGTAGAASLLRWAFR